MNTYRQFIVAMLLGAVSVGSAPGVSALEEKKLSTSPPALDAPAWRAGQEWHGLRNDKDYKYWLVAKKGSVYSWKDSYGKNDRDCAWSTAGHEFSPSLKWKDCRGWPDGSQKVRKKGGPWPLEVGKKWSYKIKGKDKSGESWKTTRKCHATSAVTIKTGLGSSDTFKVVCEDSWRVRVYYISVTDGFLVYQRDKSKSGGKTVTFERTQLVGAEG